MNSIAAAIFFCAVIASLFLVLSLTRGMKSFFLILFGAKPFVDQTLRYTLVRLGGTEINLLAMWGVLTFFVLCACYFGSSGAKRAYGRGLIWAFLLLHTLVAAFSAYSGRRGIVSVLEMLIRVATPYLFYFVFSRYWEDDVFRNKLVKTIWLANLLAMILSLGFYVQGMGYTDISQNVNRFSGFYGDSATLSLVGFTALGFGILYRELMGRNLRGLLKLSYYATLGAYAILFWITLTKATILITLAFVILWWGFYKRKKILIFPLILVGIVYIYTSSERVQSRFAKEVSFFSLVGEEDVSLDKARGMGSGRMGRWINTMDIYNNEYSFTEKLVGTYMTFKSHNQYISYLMQVGAVGLGLFLLLILFFYSGLLRTYRRRYDPLSFMAIIFFSSMVIYGLGYISFGFTTILWITMMLVSIQNKRDVENAAAIVDQAEKIPVDMPITSSAVSGGS